MNNRSHRLWYFEAHLVDGTRVTVGPDGQVQTDLEDILKTAYAGTEQDAHGEADRRCSAYDATHKPGAKAMSFSPASTLNPNT
jgi:hypothetical protein